MTREEAKELLQLYRPNGADAGDPFFAEALERLRVDPELAAWFEQQQAFDLAVASGRYQIVPPADLKERILAGTSRRSRWWNRALRPAELAAAAALAAILAVGGVWFHQREAETLQFRDKVVQASWSGDRHVHLETSHLPEIRRFIAAHDLPSDFKLPPELAMMRPRGCSLLHVDERKVPYICFVDETKHLHLAVFDRDACPVGAPAETPAFDRLDRLSVASWSQGDATFVLTGMRPWDFVKKFRRERQWTWGG